MSEMKMSDVFELPVNYNIDVCRVASEKGSVLVSAEAVNLKHICHAINNHDKLTETVKKQQETIDDLVCMLKGLTEEYDELLDKSINYIGSHGASGLAQAKLLLSKLNNEDCDE